MPSLSAACVQVHGRDEDLTPISLLHRTLLKQTDQVSDLVLHRVQPVDPGRFPDDAESEQQGAGKGAELKEGRSHLLGYSQGQNRACKSPRSGVSEREVDPKVAPKLTTKLRLEKRLSLAVFLHSWLCLESCPARRDPVPRCHVRSSAARRHPPPRSFRGWRFLDGHEY